jgi:hypothetical protein
MDNYDLLQVLQSLNGGQQSPNPMMSQMQQQNPAGYLAGIGNPNTRKMMNQQQNQQPSWLDALNYSMMLGNMMPQQQPYNQYAMGQGMMGNQAQPNWWQKGLQATGKTLSGAAPLAIGAGGVATGSIAGLPAAPFLLGGGIAAGGLGSLFQHLGQPGQMPMQPMQQGGWA